MNDLKAWVGSFIAGIFAYLNPVNGDLLALLLVMALNFACGLSSGLLVANEGWKFKKAFRCVIEGTVFMVLVCAIYIIGDAKGNEEGALQCISFVTYSVFYFYGVNILRNLKLLFPKSRTIAFLYDVLSIEFAKRIPGLSDYIGKEVKNEQSNA